MGVILGMGLIVSDTTIVWIALGGTLRMTGVQPWYLPHNWQSAFRNTGSTMTTYIYYTSLAGEGYNYAVDFGASLVLMVIIIVLSALTALLILSIALQVVLSFPYIMNELLSLGG